MKYLKENDGVSLIIVTIISAVFMLAMLGVAEVWIKTFQEMGDFDASRRAEYLAKSVSNFATKWADNNEVGANVKSEDLSDTDLAEILKTAEWAGIENCKDINPDPSVTKRCVGFRVIGSAQSDAKVKVSDLNTFFYSVPAAYKDEKGKLKGTGSAAEECVDAENADDPCHWNKLYPNEATEIPLYVEDTAITPFSQIKIRARSPCGEFKLNESMHKYECSENVDLYPKVSSGFGSPFRNIEKDKVLIQWLILDGEKTVMARDESYYDEKTKTKKRLIPTPNNDGSITDNTEISAGRINDAKGSAGGNSPLKDFLGNYVILDEKYSGMDLKKNEITFKSLIESDSQLRFYFNFVGIPRKEDNNDSFVFEFTKDQLNDSKYFLPYLEYQILTDEPIADSKTNLFGWAKVSDFYKTSKGKMTFPVSPLPFVLGNL